MKVHRSSNPTSKGSGSYEYHKDSSTQRKATNLGPGPIQTHPKRDDTMLTYGSGWGYLCPTCNLFREGWQTRSEALDSYLEHRREH